MSAPNDESSLTLRTQGALDRARLGNVRSLNLWTDSIRDLSRLRRAPLLEKLVLDETSVRDLSPLAGAPRLGELHLYDNPEIEDLSPLGELLGLHTLEVGAPSRRRFATRGLRSIARLPALVSLRLWATGRAKLAWLASLVGLEKLLVWGGRIDAGWLSGLRHLRELNLTRTGTSDLGPLAGLRELEDLWLCENRIRDLRPLRGLGRLTRLLLQHNAIEDIGPLVGLTRLERLDANYNRLTNLPSLAKLTRLETLDLGHNALTDAARVSGLRRLEYLYLTHNQLTEVSGLRDLPRLQCLFLAHNRVRDLRPLLRLRSLVAVTAEGNRADTSCLMALPKLIRVDSTFKRDLEPGG